MVKSHSSRYWRIDHWIDDLEESDQLWRILLTLEIFRFRIIQENNLGAPGPLWCPAWRGPPEVFQTKNHLAEGHEYDCFRVGKIGHESHTGIGCISLACVEPWTRRQNMSWQSFFHYNKRDNIQAHKLYMTTTIRPEGWLLLTRLDYHARRWESCNL